MRRLISAFLLLFLLASCAAPAGEEPSPEVPDEPPAEAPMETCPEEVPAETGEAEDHLLLTLEAPLADGRTLTLEAWGRVLDEYTTGVREVRVYDGEKLLQTVLAREGNLAFWGDSGLLPGESVSEYTQCWNAEDSMEAVDLNFDGNTDLGLFAFVPNNTIPYYYWTWDAEAEQYRYAFTLQGVAAHPEEREISAEYKSGSAGSQWIVEYYRPDETGMLYLDRVERDTCDFEPEPPSQLDFDRGWAHETWVPPEGTEPIRPDNDYWILEQDFLLTYREAPVFEVDAGNTVSHFTEIWEYKGSQFQRTSREEYVYDDEQP